MAFDLALIERALDGAVADTEQELAQREIDYAGFADVAKLPIYREAAADAKAARAEFAKLRRAIEGAPRVTATRNGVVRTAVGACEPDAHYLLVKADG